MGHEKIYKQPNPTPKNFLQFIISNSAIRIVIFAVCILGLGYCVNIMTSHVEKPKDVYRYEVKLSNWVGHTVYRCSYYERTEHGTYKLYNEDSTIYKEFEVSEGWKIEITNIEK